MSRSRGKFVKTTAFVDASFGQNKKNCKFHRRHVIFANCAPLLWYSKQQKIVKTSAFSAEYIALKVCVEAIKGLRHKMRMFGVPLRGERDYDYEPTCIYCDNKSIFSNGMRVESTMTKKHVSIAYHFTRFCVAHGMIPLSWIDGCENIVDVLSKRLLENVRNFLFGNWTYETVNGK